MITAHEVKVLAEKFAKAAAAKDIPTGELWRSITADQYLKAKLELFNAIDELATQQPGDPEMITAVPSVSCKLIGICGHARSGKDTVGAYLHASRDNTWKLAFADPLKQAAATMFGIPEDSFYEDDLKEVADPFWGVSPRQIAQFFGTEMVRQNVGRLIPELGENFWIRRLIQTLNGTGDSVAYDADDVVIITDVRFQNEYDWIISQGGIIIHLTRPGADGTVGISGHASEAGLSFTAPSQTHALYNTGSLEELYAQVDTIIAQANIYPFSNPELY